jgi:hypothetical protein
MYELWNTASQNMIGTFPSAEDAVEVVRQSFHKYGRAYATPFALGNEDMEGETTPIATGDELVDRAMATPA